MGVWSGNRRSTRKHYFENGGQSVCCRVSARDERYDDPRWNPYDERTCPVCREILEWRCKFPVEIPPKNTPLILADKHGISTK